MLERLSSETGLITLCSSAQPVVNYLSACSDRSHDRDESFLKDKQICQILDSDIFNGPEQSQRSEEKCHYTVKKYSPVHVDVSD